MSLSNLATWSVQSVKGNKEFASYLRDNGVFLITKWALLADTSQSRIKLALERYGNSNKEDISYLLKLHNSYLEKYSPSKQQLKVYLLKKYLLKIKGSRSKKEVSAIIDEIILNLEKNKILNDEMYSDSKARMFLKRGYSLNKINQSLRSKGIEDKYVKQSIDKIKENEIEPDFVSALKLCKRRRIGPLRPESNRELFYKKDMGILARGGFSFDLSKRVLDLDTHEFNKLIKLI